MKQYPRALTGFEQAKDNMVWIKFTIREFLDQFAFGRRDSEIVVKGKTYDTLMFLVTDNLKETVNHTWGEYDSLAKNIAQEVLNISKSVNTISNVAKGSYQAVTGFEAKGDQVISAANIRGVLDSAVGAVRSETVLDSKIDTAVVYLDTARRDYQFDFILINEGDPVADIVEPIKTLMKYSCADIKTALTGIYFPAIFEIESYPGGMIKIDSAALTHVDAVYEGPFTNGYPMMARLTLSFKEIAPLYQSSFADDISKGIKITHNAPSKDPVSLGVQAAEAAKGYAKKFKLGGN